ncbi:MAG: hypothetical protein KAW86_02480 [Bacteroidales bacterium]|nr:hypothetical protein [Bacteroidales bacterium]
MYKNYSILFILLLISNLLFCQISNDDGKKKYPYNSDNKLNIGISLNQHFNYVLTHSNFSIILNFSNHLFYIGPVFTKLLSDNPYNETEVDYGIKRYDKNFLGINWGYRNYFNSKWERTHFFLQLDFSLYKLKYQNHSMGSGWYDAEEITLENTFAFGLDYRVIKGLGIFGGIGFGSNNYFFLALDSFIPNAFIGIEYIF